MQRQQMQRLHVLQSQRMQMMAQHNNTMGSSMASSGTFNQPRNPTHGMSYASGSNQQVSVASVPVRKIRTHYHPQILGQSASRQPMAPANLLSRQAFGMISDYSQSYVQLYASLNDVHSSASQSSSSTQIPISSLLGPSAPSTAARGPNSDSNHFT